MFENKKLIDLTYILNSSAPTFTGRCGFKIKDVVVNENEPGPPSRFVVQSFAMIAGIGTHVDAPVHVIPGTSDIAQIPLDNLHAPCFVIDVSDKAHADYQVSVQDIEEFEKQYGTITEKSFVAVYTGWSKYWNDSDAYRNVDENNKMHFPCLSKEAAEFLAARKIVGLGIDTLSPDCADPSFPVHDVFLSKEIYIAENVANLEKMPATGAHIIVSILNIKGGTESPARIVGIISE